jgi:hypothetical protein
MAGMALDAVRGKLPAAQKERLEALALACEGAKGSWALDVSAAAMAMWSGKPRLEDLGEKWGDALEAAIQAKALPKLVDCAGRLSVKLAVEQGDPGQGPCVALVGISRFDGHISSGHDFGGGAQRYPVLGPLSESDGMLWRRFVEVGAPWIWSVAGPAGRAKCLPGAEALMLEREVGGAADPLQKSRRPRV